MVTASFCVLNPEFSCHYVSKFSSPFESFCDSVPYPSQLHIWYTNQYFQRISESISSHHFLFQFVKSDEFSIDLFHL